MVTVKEKLMECQTVQRIVLEDISEEEWESLGNIEIKEQYMVNMIIETLMDYPSLIHQLANMHCRRLVLDSVYGNTKPVLWQHNDSVVLYVNK